MKFIIYSDIHFYHGWSEFNPIGNDSIPLRLKHQVDVWKQIDELAFSKGAIKLFSGDLFHKRSFLHSTVYSQVLELYKNSKASEILIPGNHDRFDKNLDAVTPLNKIFGDIGGYTTVLKDQEKQTIIMDATIYGAHAGSPIPKPDKRNERKGFHNILLCHGMLHGAKLQNGFEVKRGYTLKDFEGYDLVVMGDIHKKQQHGNVLIPGSPLQQNWGDAGEECGCWEYNSESKKLEFIPLKAPKFNIVTQDNIEEVLKTEIDDYNYYDFRLKEGLSKAEYKEVKNRFPNSYISVKKEDKKSVEGISISRTSSLDEILSKYFEKKLTGDREAFIEKAKGYLSKVNPNLAFNNKSIIFRGIKAENFLSLKSFELNYDDLAREPYLICGENGQGKSTIATEVLIYTLYNQLTRSSTKSRDGIIHDPTNSGKGKNLFTQVHIEINGDQYFLQRFRKHDSLGSGSRILVKK